MTKPKASLGLSLSKRLSAPSHPQATIFLPRPTLLSASSDSLFSQILISREEAAIISNIYTIWGPSVSISGSVGALGLYKWISLISPPHTLEP